jgi:hypothetical protein
MGGARDDGNELTLGLDFSVGTFAGILSLAALRVCDEIFQPIRSFGRRK